MKKYGLCFPSLSLYSKTIYRTGMKLFNRKLEFPNTYVIVFAVVLAAAAATWFLPGGQYVQVSGQDSPGSAAVRFEYVDSVPQTWQVAVALFRGFEKQAGIIAFIFIIGGSFWIVNSVRAVDAGIYSFLNFTSRLEKNRVLRKLGVNNIVLVLVMLLFSLFGAVFGMSEETIAFAALIIPLAISMGYDSIVGVCIVYVAAHVGFAGAMLNPFTVGVAQNLSGVPMFSGIEYRTLCWLLLTVLTMAFVLIYAGRIRKNPRKSPTYNEDSYWREREKDVSEKPEVLKTKASWFAFALSSLAAVLFSVYYAEDCVIAIGNTRISMPWMLPAVSFLYILSAFLSLRKSVRFFVLDMLGFSIVFLIIGVLGYSWYIGEISALFLSLGILSGTAAGYSANRCVKEFLDGAKDIFSAALIVGLASGIVIILQDGRVIDTILHSMASGLEEGSRLASLSIMYGIQTFLNLFIPSATAKAAITMPIMAPFSDLIGVSRQATVLAFQFGDGFTNMITPTSGVLMAVLGIARIPYVKWLKWVWKFILLLIVTGFLMLVPTVLVQIPGF